MTAGRKRDAVLRVLRGKPLEIVARESAVTAADLSGWRDAFLKAGEAGHGQDRPAGGRRRDPFRAADVEAMSAVVSISARRRYGVARVWGVARSGVYRSRRAPVVPPAPRRRPGPQGPMDDAALVEAILKTRPRDDRDATIGRLRAKVGELTMEGELPGGC